MPALDKQLVYRAVEALRVSAALIIEEAKTAATCKLPAAPQARLEVISRIDAAASDAALLAAACEVLIRNGRP